MSVFEMIVAWLHILEGFVAFASHPFSSADIDRCFVPAFFNLIPKCWHELDDVVLLCHCNKLERKASKGTWKAFHKPDTISFELLTNAIIVDKTWAKTSSSLSLPMQRRQLKPALSIISEHKMPYPLWLPNQNERWTQSTEEKAISPIFLVIFLWSSFRWSLPSTNSIVYYIVPLSSQQTERYLFPKGCGWLSWNKHPTPGASLLACPNGYAFIKAARPGHGGLKHVC